ARGRLAAATGAAAPGGVRPGLLRGGAAGRERAAAVVAGAAVGAAAVRPVGQPARLLPARPAAAARFLPGPAHRRLRQGVELERVAGAARRASVVAAVPLAAVGLGDALHPLGAGVV